MIRNTKRLVVIALVLILAFTATATSISIVAAHDPPQDIPTFAFVSVSASVVGRGQSVVVFMWLDKAPPTATGPFGDRWENFKVTVTKPDGTTATLGPFESDPIGFFSTTYTPDQTGTYSFKFDFPGQTLAGKNMAEPSFPGGPAPGEAYVGDYFMPSQSSIATLTVQDQTVPNYPSIPLPASYWTRPINAQNHDWSNAAGNWLMLPSNSFARYTQAPRTPHIMWAKPLTFGGLVGGEYGAVSYYTGNAYEGKFWPPVIINGVFYYNQFPSSMAYSESDIGFANYNMPGVHAVDLRTGEELWYNPEMRIDFGQIYRYDSMNQHGAIAYLWRYEGDTWMCYDAYTGQWLFNVTNVPSGVGGGGFGGAPFAFGTDGSIQGLVFGPSGGFGGPPVTPTWMAMWNPMSIPELTGAADIPGAALDGTAGYMWRPFNKVVDGNHGYVWNVSIPAGITGSVSYIFTDSNGNLDSVVLSEFLTGTGGAGFFSFDPTTTFTLWRINLKTGHQGELLWKKTYTTLAEGGAMALGAASLEEGVFTIWCSQTRQHWGFSLSDGNKIWGPTEAQPSWDFTVATTHAIAYGKLFSIGMGGALHIYDVKTGTLLHTTPLAIPYLSEAKWSGNYPIACVRIAEEKIYLFTGEHSPDNPAERSTPLACVDVNTGEMLWSIPFYASHWATNPSIADGYLVYMNAYDNQIYCFGKGPSATTVTATAGVGNSVTIQGTVTDISAGAKQKVQAGEFNIVPAVSDASMGSWMQYLYMQQPMPNANGVTVKITALDPAGNNVDIGTTTTDISGKYGISFIPQSPGTYRITATFAGSDSYYGSTDTTFLAVGGGASPFVSPSQAVNPEAAPNAVLYVGIAAILIIAVVAILALILRRRK